MEIQDTIDTIKKHFYFPRLAAKVSQYIQSCFVCHTRKPASVAQLDARPTDDPEVAGSTPAG